jgi:hypothetical protein
MARVHAPIVLSEVEGRSTLAMFGIRASTALSTNGPGASA